MSSAASTASTQAAGTDGASDLPPRTSATQPVLRPWLRAQALNLGRHALALRDFQRAEFGEGPEAPTEGHIQAVNQLMSKLRVGLTERTERMNRLVNAAVAQPRPELLAEMGAHKGASHRWVQRIERIWDFYLELFGQRQSGFGSWLLSADRIALDCYQHAYMGLGLAKSVPAPAPFNYMRTGFGPATYRRGIKLKQLGRELNPFPLIQLPYHRLINPWTLGAILHEVSHNLHSDLGLNRVVPLSIAKHLMRAGFGADVVRVWTRWNREIFADLSGLLLGGPAVIASLMDVVGLSPEIALSYRPSGVHPIPYLRVLLSVELLRRMGFAAEAEKYAFAWKSLYPDPASRLPGFLLKSARPAMRAVVAAVCYQPFAALGNKALAEVYSCGQKEQRMIEEAAHRLGKGSDPGIVPKRFLIGAARFALDNRLATPQAIRENFYRELSRR